MSLHLTMSPLYLVKLKNGQPLSAVHSVEPIVPNFRRKSFNVRFFPCLLENSCSSLLTIFYILMGFIKIVSSNSIWLILACKLKLNCHDL